MKTLQDYQTELLEQENAQIKKDGYDEKWLLDFSDLDTNELMSMWLKDNPIPEITDLDSFEQAMSKAMWALRSDEAATVFSGEDYPINVESCRNSIEQAIINRVSSKTMLQAALDYVENRTQNL